jgi:hypothetical protein
MKRDTHKSSKTIELQWDAAPSQPGSSLQDDSSLLRMHHNHITD